MKNFILLLSILCGILFPYGREYVFLIRYLLMVMLFFAFLDIKLDLNIIQKSHFIILGLIVSMALFLFVVIDKFNHDLAQSTFITAIAPTAIAAPVIISLKKKKVEYVMFSLLLNNMFIALLIPFILPTIVGKTNLISISAILFPVIVTITIPFIMAKIVKSITPQIWRKLVSWKDYSFYILVINIYLAVSDAFSYIKNEMSSNLSILLIIGLISLILCVVNFSLGWFVGRKNFPEEASQSLGQKNNAFVLWISITFMNPLATLGPVFYILFQNIYISWELYRHKKETVLQKRSV
ncbi:MAG: hypothetical protein HXX18_15195 [Bacteroidetes bacterium]|nr:hypothetical protein [Bacteroidota bacterium]